MLKQFLQNCYTMQFIFKGWMAEWLCSGLQSRSLRFDSDSASNIMIYKMLIWSLASKCPSGGIGRHKGLKIPR